MELNFEGLEIQNWNIPMERTGKGNEKNGAIFLVIMFTPRVMFIKMPKNGSFFLFSANESKKLVTVWAKYLSAPERSYWFLSENGMVNRLWSYRSWVIEGRNIKKTAESAKNTKIMYI